jgi:hypothetical protein
MAFERNDDDRVSAKLLFYREADPSLSFSWPYASSDYYKSYTNAAPVGGIISFERDLHWEGDLGLYEKHWKDWTNWHSERKKVIMTAHLTLNDILAFDFGNAIYIDSQIYLVESLSFTLGQNGISESKLTLYKR